MPAEVSVLIVAKDKATRVFKEVEDSVEDFERTADSATSEVGDHFERLERISTATLAIATVGALRDVSEEMDEMAQRGGQVESVRRTFEQLIQTVGGDAPAALERFSDATRGTLSELDAMQAANQFLAMGLAQNTEEAAELLEASTQLATAMGQDAKQGAEAFALMLANQSIPRMDTFGLSAGRARERINELLAANADMTREQAFTQAALEQSREKMEELGDTLQGTAGDLMRAQAQSDNFSNSLAERLAPALSKISAPLKSFTSIVAPAGQLAMGLTGLTELGPSVVSGLSNIALAGPRAAKGLYATASAAIAAEGGLEDLLLTLTPVVAVIGAIATATYLFETEVTPRLGLPEVPERLKQAKDALRLFQMETSDFARTLIGQAPVHEDFTKRMMADLVLYGKLTDETRTLIKERGKLEVEEKEQIKLLGELEVGMVALDEAGGTIIAGYSEMVRAYEDLEDDSRSYVRALEDEGDAFAELSFRQRNYMDDQDEMHFQREQDIKEVQQLWQQRLKLDEKAQDALRKEFEVAQKARKRVQEKIYRDLGIEHGSYLDDMEDEEERHRQRLEDIAEDELRARRSGYVDVEGMKEDTVEKLADIETRYTRRIATASDKRKGILAQEMAETLAKAKEKGQERVEVAVTNAAARRNAEVGAISAARQAEAERHAEAIAAFEEEQQRILLTTALQVMAARTYDDGTTALQRMFGEGITGAEDFWEAFESGQRRFSMEEIENLMVLVQSVDKQAKALDATAKENEKRLAKLGKTGVKSYKNIAAKIDDMEPPLLSIQEEEKRLADMIVDVEDQTYEVWTATDRMAEGSVDAIETVVQGYEELEAEAIAHERELGNVGAAYWAAANEAARAIYSIPAWPSFPRYTPEEPGEPPFPPTIPPETPPGEDPRLPVYQGGGIVPGPAGLPQLSVLHGGEEVLTRQQRKGRGGGYYDFRGASFYGIDEDMVEEMFEAAELKRRLQGIRENDTF